MNTKLLILNLTSLACVISAAYTAINAIDGWGWFLLVALACHVTPDKKKTVK